MGNVLSSKWEKLPMVVEAFQWFRVSDAPDVVHPLLDYMSTATSDGAYTDDHAFCGVCKRSVSEHGWINTLEAGHRVCPGDFIITGVQGETYPCKSDIFLSTYMKVDAITPTTYEQNRTNGQSGQVVDGRPADPVRS